ncbi:MAG: flagellar motor switch protein [Rhodobacterales bacterium]
MALLIDMIILLLLLGTLTYAFLVDRRVRTLMAALKALEPVVNQFSSAVDRTEDSVKSLRAEGAARTASKREDEPPLTRTAAQMPNQSAHSPAGSTPDLVFRSVRMPARATPAQLPPGMARVTGKADLVRGFFDTIRSREA